MKQISVFLDKIKMMNDFNKVKFIILYGSVSRNKENKLSDIDLCVYYDGTKRDAFKMRMKLLGSLNGKYDVQIFKSLPLYLRKEVLGGKVVYVKDRRFLYEVAYSTIKEFDDFKKHYYQYINYNGKKD